LKNIYVRLMGGLGNQLFQYAAARSLADKLGVELVLDGRYVVRKGHHTGLAIDCFNIRARHISPKELRSFSEVKIRFARWLKRLIRPVNTVFWETSLAFDSTMHSQGAGTMLVGFWQSQRYISSNMEIRKDLQLCAPLGVGAATVAAQIALQTSVALHVRRGDYLKDEKTMARYGLCSSGYYNKALDYVIQQVGDVKVFVFSDDPEWVKKHLNVPDDACFSSAPSITAEEDLVLISLCDHQIIANSTFSWWGAWLNLNHAKIVVAPQPWFDDTSIQAQDLIPDEWHQINK
jgi:hypothetical protein